MQTIEQLNKAFAIDGVAGFEHGNGELPKLVITARDADAEIYLHGAHLTHYQPRGQQPVLYVSPKSAFETGKPIRGGVPIIFPWFGPKEGEANAPMHGFVRSARWDVTEVRREGDGVRAAFAFASSRETRATWNFDFELKFTVTIGRELHMQLEIENTSSHEFIAEDAL